MSGCKAHRVNDEFHCGACGLQWPVDDTDPPDCRVGHGTSTVYLDGEEWPPADQPAELPAVRGTAEADPVPEEWLREARRLLDDET